MKRNKRDDLYLELRKRLQENRKLYKGAEYSSKSRAMRFVASYLGVNPWKVLVPVSLVVVVFMRVLLGKGFSELVLRVLGGA